jgi:hypothetical protein
LSASRSRFLQKLIAAARAAAVFLLMVGTITLALVAVYKARAVLDAQAQQYTAHASDARPAPAAANLATVPGDDARTILERWHEVTGSIDAGSAPRETQRADTTSAGTFKADAAPSIATIKADAAPSVGAIKADAAPSIATVKADAAPSVAPIKADAAPSVATVKADAAPSIATIKADAAPSVAAVNADAARFTTIYIHRGADPPSPYVVRRE